MEGCQKGDGVFLLIKEALFQNKNRESLYRKKQKGFMEVIKGNNIRLSIVKGGKL